MAMYTKFNIDCSFKLNTPLSVINNIKELIKGNNEQLGYQRNPILGFELTMKDNLYYLKGKKDVNNRYNDIEKFVDYITPYVEEGFGCDSFGTFEYVADIFYMNDEYVSKEYIGWFAYQLYEEFDIPTFYYLIKELE